MLISLISFAHADGVDYSKHIQPIFAEHCYGCHGPETQESNYRLDVRDRALSQGDLGQQPIVPGDSTISALIRFVSRADSETAMPPSGDGRPLEKDQVELLRFWIDAGARWPDEMAGDPEEKITTDHWSFQPVAQPIPRDVESDWPSNSIDKFIFAALQTSDLQPSEPADRVTLMRRLYLDVHGLPPTRQQVAEFVNDGSDTAYVRLIDRVLNCSHYGERWARHWLDVVRFGESTGYEVNRDRENAYYYRDYVIDALNSDKSYRDFVIEQLAGDVVGADIGTGFLVGGPYDMVKSPDKNLTLMQRQDELADYVNTTATAFLGLTVGCARCHNHKFDPILQADYYSMQAVFAGVQHGEREIADSPFRYDSQQLRDGVRKAYIGSFKQPEKIHRLYRGDPLAPREVVMPDALAVVSSLGLSNETPESERRLALGKWIASADNPLAARVIVNRVWHYHFGTGLVSTPSDFGKNGAAPSHPELLDWLASSFMQHGWSLKWLHHQILSSSTYQQSSQPRAEALAKDADTHLLWRFPPRRLEAEAIRDCVLQVSGALNKQAGGPGFLLFEVDHENVHHYFPKEEFGPSEFRRMIYMTKIRQEQDEIFGVFDCPDGGQVIPDRSRSTTPLQALSLLNSKFMLQQAEFLAKRVRDESGESARDQVESIFQLAYSRHPDAVELTISMDLIEKHGLGSLARAIFNSNEFLFLP